MRWIDRWPRIFVFAAVAGFLGSAGTGVAAQAPKTASQAVRASEPEAQPVAAAPAVSVVTQSMVQQGVLSCASRVNQVANFLTGGNQSGAYVFKPDAPPDQRLVTMSFEINRPKVGVAYASASMAPNQANGCGAVYETVEYGATSCSNLEKQLFAGLKRVGMIKQEITILDAGSLKVFLMPAGQNGCVVIKKEIVQ